jgi:hypothetical protein
VPFTVKDIPSAYLDVRQKARRPHLAAGTLDGTAGLHEGLCALLSRRSEWNSRAHFIGECIVAVWNAKLDYVKKRTVRNAAIATSAMAVDAEEARATEDGWSTVVDAITDLEKDETVKQRQRISTVMAYRLFVGSTLTETAREIGVSVSQVRLDQAFFEAWVKMWLQPERERVEAAIRWVETDPSLKNGARIAEVARQLCLENRRLLDVAGSQGRPRKDVQRDLQLFCAWVERGGPCRSEMTRSSSR